jgi:hypothetical protein
VTLSTGSLVPDLDAGNDLGDGSAWPSTAAIG